MNILFNILPTRKRRRKRRRSARKMNTYQTSMVRPAVQQVPLVPVVQWMRSSMWSRMASLICIAASGAVLFLFFWSYDFYVYEATIEGNTLLSKEEIFAQSKIEGYNIFFIDPREVRRTIAAMPTVKEAEVSSALPNQVTVRIVERKPAAVWETQDMRYWVDQEGIFFPITSPIPTDTLFIRDMEDRPVILGVPVKPVTGTVADTPIPPDPTAVLTAQALHRYLPEQTVWEYNRNRGISFVDDGGWRVYFGNRTGLQAKVAIYFAFKEKRAPFRSVEFLDLSIPGQPYYKLKGSDANQLNSEGG